MKSLKLTFIALTLTFLASSAMAQEMEEKKTPEERAKMQTERMTEKLLLNPDQKAKVYEINLQIDKKNQAVHQDKSMLAETKKATMDSNNQTRKEMIKAVLTPEQNQKFDEMEAHRQERKIGKEQKFNLKAVEQQKAQPIQK